MMLIRTALVHQTAFFIYCEIIIEYIFNIKYSLFYFDNQLFPLALIVTTYRLLQGGNLYLCSAHRCAYCDDRNKLLMEWCVCVISCNRSGIGVIDLYDYTGRS